MGVVLTPYTPIVNPPDICSWFISYPRRLTDLRHWLDAWPDADWGAATAAIEQVLVHLERNINPTLALTNMILDVREAISNQPSAVSC